MSEKHIDLFADVDIIQLGARNMQNFMLLKELGRSNKPILLKRGLSATMEEFLMAAEYEGCNEAVKRIVPRVDMDAVDAFIGTAPYLSDLQRAFYKHYIRARYELILAPAFDLVTGLEQEPG